MKSLGFSASLLNVALAISPQFRPYEVRRLVPSVTGIQHRIYGGTEASEGQFPFMVLVLMSLSPPGHIAKCSSSLISSEWVLLAAHCLNHSFLRPKDILLVGQKADLSDYIREKFFETSYDASMDARMEVQERIARNFYIHPHYSPLTLEHDVGLIRVRSPFQLGYKMGIIPISTSKIKAPKMCTILGWGNIDNYKLNYVENKKVMTTRIGCNYKSTGPFICLQKDGTGICQGDSGGPLVCDGKVWGVASHYITEGHLENCEDSLEEYYSELYEDIEWIKSIYGGGGGGSVAGTSLKVVLSCLVFLWLSAKS